jgi:hypothetical protein
MQIYIKSSERVFALTVESGADVNDLKEQIENVEYIEAEHMRLQIGARTLECGQLELEEDDVVELLLDVDGGMRAKWRKKRMRRLRRKRRKMRQRAR